METGKTVLTGRAGKTWCCHTLTRVLLSDSRMSCWKVDLNCGKESNAKTWMFFTQGWMKTIYLRVHNQCRNREQNCGIDSSAKRDQKYKVWATRICPCVRFLWGECHMCHVSPKNVLWPAPEAPSSTETHRNTLICREIPQIWINVGRLCCSLVCELTGERFLSLFVISAQCDRDKVSLACSREVWVYPFVSSAGRVSFSLWKGWNEYWWRWIIQLPLLPRAWDDPRELQRGSSRISTRECSGPRSCSDGILYYNSCHTHCNTSLI